MHNKESIEKKFKEAGLRLRLAEVNRNSDIFGLTVQGGMHNEVFVMQPGHETNTVQILDVDKKEKQVLVHVKEEEREFFVDVWNHRKKKYDKVPRKTPESKRKLLMGMDERSYFMAEVADNAINIRDAKERLKNPDLKRDVKTVRQGEWFFQPVRDTSFIDEALGSGDAVVFEKVGIGSLLGTPGGNPHVADEVVRVRSGRFADEDPEESGWRRKIFTTVRDRRRSEARLPSDRFYARGKVRHPDHKTVEFHQWMRVLPNTEVRSTAGPRNFID